MFRLHWKRVTESTNLDARAGAHGDVYTADAQTAGRGRLDHRWHTAEGENLAMSVVLGVKDMAPEAVATFPLVVGIAVHHALEGLLDGKGAKLALKWPNDVLCDGRKVAGILCELHGENVIAGIGVNVNSRSFPPEIAERATSLALLADRELGLDQVRDGVLDQLGRMYHVWREGGFAALHADYAQIDCLKGRMVAVRRTDDDPAPAHGLCAGVQVDGTLLVAGESIAAGEAHVLM